MNTNFRNAVLNDFDFSGRDLSHVSFAGANLTGCDFSRCKLRYTDFSGAKLYRAKFIDAECIATDFSNADLSSSNFHNAFVADNVTTMGALLYHMVGDGRLFLSVHILPFVIVMCRDDVAIGHKQFTFDEWINFSREELQEISEVYTDILYECINLAAKLRTIRNAR